jgi:acetyltransferase-like isoleucine patch superfamily enzyme
MIRTLLRRALSTLAGTGAWLISGWRGIYFRTACPDLQLPCGTAIGSGVRLSATDGGRISVGINVSFGPHCQIIARRGGRIRIGDNVQLGQGCIVTALEGIDIGRDCLVAEYVVIRDQDHDPNIRPIQHGGFKTAAIVIGEGCWLGAKSTVLRGSVIGHGAVIGAHALVRGMIPDHSLAVGVPAKAVKRLAAPDEGTPS